MEMIKLGDLASYINGYAFKPEDRGDVGLPIIRIQDLTGNAHDLGFYNGEYPPKIEINNGDVLISWSASLGVYVWNRGKALLNQHIFKVVFDKEHIDKNYFVYALMCKLSEMKTKTRGATMKHIIKKDFDAIMIPYPPILEQSKITNKLDRITKIIEQRKQELQLLDKLIKARFVEMFGDPLDKFTINKFFVECVEFNPKKSEIRNLMNGIVSFVPMECVGVDGSFTTREDGLVQDYYKGYTYFRDGDVLLAKITPCFENGKVAIAENCTNGIGFGTTEFHVSRPIEGVSNSYWIKYMLKNNNVHNLATINMTGTAGQKRIQTPFFEKLKVYLPPIELQNEFAIFVKQVDKSKLI
ncbi:restriction endonuclease subunit S [Peptoanaerobacter stomatis]|uniref:restriction endonuclease subunit S n=1 Tax=Peptoanaerobacter stomatis TaxID=796937 RepID=UPI003FA0CAAE